MKPRIKTSPRDAANHIIGDLAKGRSIINVGDAKLLLALKKVIPGAIQKVFDQMSNDFIAKKRSAWHVVDNTAPNGGDRSVLKVEQKDDRTCPADQLFHV